ncbi:MAG: hypothetical protein MUE42_10345 [Opitutaceae bacterium]|jgi:hypothetical protein|nr:hypothetical protein [Opitutaceae bacterium]
MLFSSKSKGYICDQNEQSTVIARVTSLDAPLVVEAIVECSSFDEAGLRAGVVQVCPKKPAGYLHAICGVSPEQRFVRRASLDPKRLKEADYLSEVATTQFRIDAVNSAISVLNAFDGTDFDPAKSASAKEVFFCGMPGEDVTKAQTTFLSAGIYPERLEISTVAALGAIIDYLRYSKSQKPTIVLELGANSTQSFIISTRGLEASRPIAVGLEAMVPVVQKELGLKDEESARKLFFSNTFDFTGMGSSLCKRLLKELQSSMGFYEVQTGQSIGQLVCIVLPSKLAWLEAVIASQIGVGVLQPEFAPWLAARNITLSESVAAMSLDARKFALFGLMTQFPIQSNDVAV